jgi:hypothetical protein
MPQPISAVRPNANIIIGNNADPTPFSQRPQLAPLAIEGIASWSTVESFMLRLYVTMCGGPEDKAAAIFLSLESQSPKSAAIQAVAKFFPADQQALLRAILAISKTRQKHRDKLAHWVWGTSRELPDALLLVNPRTTIWDQINRDDVFVYTSQDFNEIINANRRLAGHISLFRMIISGHLANRNNELYDELCAVPEIREKLDRRV